MATTPPAPPDQPPTEHRHGPLAAQRIPRAEVDPTFAQNLQANGQVRAVPEGWRSSGSEFPPGVTWVVYPNGDLERIGFD